MHIVCRLPVAGNGLMVFENGSICWNNLFLTKHTHTHTPPPKTHTHTHPPHTHTHTPFYTSFGLKWILHILVLIGGVPGRGRARGRVPPETSKWKIFADLPGKKRQGKKVKWSRKEGNRKMEGFLFAVHFKKKQWNSFWFWKKHFTPGKKSGKMTLPLWKIFLLHPWSLWCYLWF